MWWSISVHSLPGDYFPPRAVGSVYGIAGTGSTVGSVISTWAVGRDARRDPQLRPGVHRHRAADANRPRRRLCVDEEG